MLIKHLGVVDYETTALAMQTFTRERTANTPDELWMCEHPRVYTLGLSARAGDLLQDLGIPMVQTNRADRSLITDQAKSLLTLCSICHAGATLSKNTSTAWNKPLSNALMTGA